MAAGADGHRAVLARAEAAEEFRYAPVLPVVRLDGAPHLAGPVDRAVRQRGDRGAAGAAR
ncbi:hypothetical protein ACIPPN_20245 [Streptomyces diastaticus]|uniref:Uncharacterized protein n=1 Tax=Streptomyces diastaticus subsp. diastaticus TaxID=68040 RepID=A0ABQ1CIJ1_STRDI|nr:hypothetical protein [Streptomyces diastaticus]GFH70120.1 hypothetical protein Sdia_08880 [Streptomyces diastaticus subsp. diastaticus]GGU15236.1 hypothetical protein GCM10015534_17340 [Streptomyces diastaticus subsp. diastaticus]